MFTGLGVHFPVHKRRAAFVCIGDGRGGVAAAPEMLKFTAFTVNPKFSVNKGLF